MGTRYLVAVYLDGEYKVAQFGAYDGYPEGAGVNVLNFLRSLQDENKVEAFIENVKACSFYNENDEYNVHKDEDYGCGEDILVRILNGDTGYKLVNSLDFAANSLFCEWCWLIDLDKLTFEGYKGFNQYELDEQERFYFLQKDAKLNHNGYLPIYLIHRWSINNLPETNEFLTMMRKQKKVEETTEETKPRSKGIPFDTFDTQRYIFLRQKQFHQYCLDLVVKNTMSDKFRIIVPDYPYKSTYNKNKTYVINLRTNKIYTAVPDGDDEYNKLTGMAIAFAKATNKRIPVLVKRSLDSIYRIKPGMQLLIWKEGVKKPYNQTVTDENIKEVKEILSKEKITKIYVI